MFDLVGFLMQWLGRPRPTPPPPPPPTPTSPTPTDLSTTDVVYWMNVNRARQGYPPLAADPRLMAVADSRARSLAARGVLSHDGSMAQVEDAFPNTPAGEIVAAGQPTARAVVDAWMGEPPDPLGHRGHRENILGQYTLVGVGVARDARLTPYWVVDFVRT